MQLLPSSAVRAGGYTLRILVLRQEALAERIVVEVAVVLQVAPLAADIGRVQSHVPGQAGLNAELILISGRDLPSRDPLQSRLGGPSRMFFGIDGRHQF